MSLTVSIVIPTYHRPKDLATCLDAILRQSVLPLEVIVVDNDAGKSAQDAVCQYEARYSARRIALRYEASQKNSSPFARNLGVKLSRGDIVVFLDDDVILEEDYLNEILKVYEAKPTALGVQGYVSGPAKPRSWRRVFFLYHVELGMCRVLPSVQVIYPLKPGTVIPCEFLIGCNASYRRSILVEFPGDENLIKYSYGEDVDQSYRIYKSYPDALWMTPFAQCIHGVSMAGRAISRERAYMVEVYGLYLFYKLFPHTPKNLAIYWWSVFGRIMEKAKHPSHKNCTELRHQLGALSFCLRHLGELRAGNLDFFNRTLVESIRSPDRMRSKKTALPLSIEQS